MRYLLAFIVAFIVGGCSGYYVATLWLGLKHSRGKKEVLDVLVSSSGESAMLTSAPYGAACSCGWMSRPLPTKEQATAAANSHLRFHEMAGGSKP